jgi:alpha-tubulin suppressor-like RCC1 family protein
VSTGLNLSCWGADPGNGSLNTPNPAAVPVPGLPPGQVGQVSAGYGGCAVTLSGAPWCWGYNFDGEVGNGTTTDQGSPAPVSGLPSVESISNGGLHVCAQVFNGGARCWGLNTNGDLGDGTTTSRDTPVQAQGLPNNLAQIAAGGDQTCALLKTALVKCWGTGSSGELGNGSTSNHSSPVSVKGLPGVVQIALGWDFSCALTTFGGVSCWGDNADGELGNGTTSNSSVPVGVSGLSSGVVAIAAGDVSACAVLQSGQVDCWGGGLSGQLGDGSFTGSTVPVTVSGFTSDGASIGLTAGGQTGCSLDATETAQCWGSNFDGQVGNGTLSDTDTPSVVTGL